VVATEQDDPFPMITPDEPNAHLFSNARATEAGLRIRPLEETVRDTLAWDEEARERLKRLPSFARGMVARSVERYAVEQGITVVTPEVMRIVREQAETRLGRRFNFSEFSRETPALKQGDA